MCPRSEPKTQGLALLACLLACLLGACAVDDAPFDRPHAALALEAATGHAIDPEATPREPRIPPGVDPSDGVDEEEAVALALWNNAEFAAVLARLDVRRAELVAAGLLRNPVFSLLFPWGPKQLEFTIGLPLEALLQRPDRVAAATADCRRSAALLIGTGLDLVRDVRLAAAARTHAARRRQLAAADADERRREADAAAGRASSGDASAFDADAARLAWRDAEREATRAACELELADAALRALVGFADDSTPLAFDDVAVPAPPAEDAEVLLAEALAARPDVRAAELALEAAGARAGLARQDWLRLSAILDANGEGSKGFEAGPGLSGELPLFHLGAEAGAVADAELQAAGHDYVATRRRAAQDVTAARLRLQQAHADWRVLHSEMLPAVVALHRDTVSAFERGDVPLASALAAERQRLSLEWREADAAYSVQRSMAELERSVGRRITEREP
ncbi:MAG: TolC family protein [Planctomycetota bacterium]